MGKSTVEKLTREARSQGRPILDLLLGGGWRDVVGKKKAADAVSGFVELMKDPTTKDIPIIFLTGLKAPRSKSKAPATNVHVIGKSNDFSELLLAIRELIGA